MVDINNVNELITSINSLNIEQIPPWALVLVQGVKVLSLQLQAVSELNERVKKLEDFKNVNEAVSSRLQAENMRLNKLVEEIQEKADDQEQRSRNQCLVFHGIEEGDKENTDDKVLHVINNTLGLGDISIDDIQRSHRIGPNQPGRQLRSSQPTKKTRPIIVRFLNWRDRKKIFINKKKLKGSKIVITENLTRNRYILYKTVVEKHGVKNTWTSDGHIMAKIDGNIRSIGGLADL